MFYTYLWLRYDGTPYYAGKGAGNRAFKTANHYIGKPGDSAQIIVQEFLTEAEAFEAEKFLISFYGRKDLGTGCLRNLTNGGEGVSGLRHSSETKLKLSRASKGRKAAYKRKSPHRGVPRSPEARQKMSQRIRTFWANASAEQTLGIRQAASLTCIARNNDPEFKKKSSEEMKARFNDPDFIAKRDLYLRDPEFQKRRIAAVVAGVKRYWENKRAQAAAA